MSTSLIQHKSTTVLYKHLHDGSPLHLDLYLPTSAAGVKDFGAESRIPTVVFFHGGGLHVGGKQNIPPWLIGKHFFLFLLVCKRSLTLGCAFISANYQLLPPASGHDIVQDIKDLFAFLAKTEISADDQRVFRADMKRIAVSGSSSGGKCAYLAAMHVSPKPKAVVGIYSPGGNLLIPQYIKAKTEPFFMGRPLLNPADYADFIYPFPNDPLKPTSDVPIVFGSPPTSRRAAMAPLYLQLGVFLDYYTGMHEPSLSASLRATLNREGSSITDLKEVIPDQHRSLFPQLAIDGTWPPTILMHGTADTAVLPEESDNFYSLLKEANVPAELVYVPDMNHMFDMAPDAERKWGSYFDLVGHFLAQRLDLADH